MSKGRNPVLPSDVYIPDGEAHVFNNRLYVYGSRDSEKETYCSDRYNVVSTDDMINWSVHEKSLYGKDIPWIGKKNSKKKKDYRVVDMDLINPTPMFQKLVDSLPKPIRWWLQLTHKSNLNLGKWMPDAQYLFAPDCMEKNGRYYLYFCMADNSEGVAVAEQPEGPFLCPVQMPCAGIDPAVFCDDDGRMYYYWGQFRACGVELNKDMKSFDEKKVVHRIVTEEEHGFHEGSSVRKRNGIYYYVYPCIYRNTRPTCLAYATSYSPLGPFRYRGILIDNAKCDPQSWNIHGSIEVFQCQWYVFYHRSSGNSNYHRRLCVEKIEFNDDGSIDEVKMTSTGAGHPFAKGETIEGWRACEVEQGAYIKDKDLIMCDGSSATIRYVILEEPATDIKIKNTGNAEISVYLDGKDVRGAAAGIHEVRIYCKGDAVIHSLMIC